MAVTLALTASFVEQNDALALVVTDTTGSDGTNDWSVGDNPDYSDIVDLEGATNTWGLYLDITLTQSDGTETVFDTIDLHDEFGGTGFGDADDMVFTITAPMLFVDASTDYDSEDTIPDGIYDISYGARQVDVSDHETDYELLLDGVVRKAVYDIMRLIPITYADSDDIDSREIREAMFAWSYLTALTSSSYVSKNEELLTQLNTLENIIRNGSNNTW